MTNSGVTTSTTFDKILGDYTKDNEVEFPIPAKMSSIVMSIEGTITKMVSKDKVKVQA